MSGRAQSLPSRWSPSPSPRRAARANARVETEEARVADILQSALVKHGGEVNRCFEKALADTLDVAGKIELAVDVGAGGRVTKAEPASDGVKSPVLLACLCESAATWTLAGIDPGSTVIVPLAFEGQTAQFSVKVKDAPDRGPPAPRRQEGRAGRRRAAVLGQAAGRRGDDARAEGGADPADDRARQPDRDAQASRAPRCCTCSRATPASSVRRASRPRSSTRGWRS